MKLGIVGAMDVEVELLKAALANPVTTRLASMDFVSGSLGPNQAVVVRCGVGKVNAALCAQALATSFGVDAIVNAGVAGSLDPRIGIGDVVVATDAVQYDVEVSALGYEPGQIPQMDLLAFPTDERLRAAALAAIADVAPGTSAWEGRVATGDRFVADAELKRWIASTFGAACCEMEGAPIAQACHLNGMRCLIVRAISDQANDAAEVVYPELEAEVAERCANIVRRLAELV